MSIEKNKPEQIVTVLRQIGVQIANGKKVPQACKEAGIHTQTYYRWRKECRGRRDGRCIWATGRHRKERRR